jgi:S1-C subfamily serine protease
VHLLRFGNEAGTCFTLTIDAKQYVITAKHVVDEIKSGDKVSIYRGGAWEEIAVSPISIGSKLDIAILVPERPVSDPSFDIGAGSLGGLNMASEVYFLGFPYGGNLSVGDRTYRLFSTLSLSGSTYPAALVKRGIISGFDDSDMESPVFYIDGMNNPGFSGGPVVFYDKTSNQPKVIGVVSARIPEELMTSKGVEAPPVWVNSGIIIAHQISSALDAIREYTKQK